MLRISRPSTVEEDHHQIEEDYQDGYHLKFKIKVDIYTGDHIIPPIFNRTLTDQIPQLNHNKDNGTIGVE